MRPVELGKATRVCRQYEGETWTTETRLALALIRTVRTQRHGPPVTPFASTWSDCLVTPMHMWNVSVRDFYDAPTGFGCDAMRRGAERRPRWQVKCGSAPLVCVCVCACVCVCVTACHRGMCTIADLSFGLLVCSSSALSSFSSSREPWSSPHAQVPGGRLQHRSDRILLRGLIGLVWDHGHN
jgi:hypothetical protein